MAENKTKVAIYTITLDDGLTCKLSKLPRAVLEQVMGMIMSKPPEMIRAGEVILRNCWVDGDQKILDDEDSLIGASMLAYELINIKQGVLKKI